MKNEVVNSYYTSQKSRLLKDFDKAMRRYGRKVLESHYGDDLADTIIRESRQEYEALIPQLPYVGGKENPWTEVLLQCAGFLGLYKALKIHGKTAEESGKLSYEMVETQLQSYPKLFRRLMGRWGFTRYSLNKLRKQAQESQKQLYPADWVFSFIEGDDKKYDYGIDITECAICKFYHAQGAHELTPFVCLTDFAMSKAFSMGLERTMTIAEGAEKCDFRYKRGREEKQGWPPEFHESNIA